MGRVSNKSFFELFHINFTTKTAVICINRQIHFLFSFASIHLLFTIFHGDFSCGAHVYPPGRIRVLGCVCATTKLRVSVGKPRTMWTNFYDATVCAQGLKGSSFFVRVGAERLQSKGLRA